MEAAEFILTFTKPNNTKLAEIGIDSIILELGDFNNSIQNDWLISN